MAFNPTLAVFNAPYGIDQTSTRMWLRGKLTFTAATYITGGMLPNWNSLLDSSGQSVTIPIYTQPPVFLITNSALTSNVITFNAVNTLVVGQYVTLYGLVNMAIANGFTLRVASRSSTQFTVAFTHANVTTAAETAGATAVQYIGPDDCEIHSVSGSGYLYYYNKSFGTVQVFQNADQTVPGAGPNTEFPASSLAAGITGDVIHVVATWAKQ